MNRARVISAALCCAFAVSASMAFASAGAFEWSTESAEAKRLLSELQQRIESFEAGPALESHARRIVEADPGFAMGVYYLSAVVPPPEGAETLARAVELAERASEGERRFIEAMSVVRSSPTTGLRDGIPLLEKLAEDYPDERLVFMIQGQLYQAASESAKARAAFERALEIGPPSARARAFIANDDLLRGAYSEARATFETMEADLPEGAVPFAIRYGVAFSHLYEGRHEEAVEALEKYLDEYHEGGASQGFPDVFIWNSIARIHLERGKPEAAMAAYEKGYESVPGSTLPEDQKQLWYGRLLHGKARTLAKMGKHEQAWAQAEEVRRMIDEGGEEAKQYLPAYHYLAGYLKLESGAIDEAVTHLEQANPADPFHRLLLARAYERRGDEARAKEAYEQVTASTSNGLERALAYPEAKRKLEALRAAAGC